MRAVYSYIAMASVGGAIGFFWDASRVGCRQVAADLVDCYVASTTASLTWIVIGVFAGLVLAALTHLIFHTIRQAASGG